MGKKLNEKFLESYIKLDKSCGEMLGVPSKGVTEYINKLNNTRSAPDRDETVKRLIRYRGIRNKLAHEVGALRRMNDVTKKDLKWVRKFDKDVRRLRDPLSKYLGASKSSGKGGVLIAIAIAAILAIAAAVYFIFLR